jgi:glutathione S-transferase
MPVTLFHHPFTRAANVLWMLEEVGVPYELQYVDLTAGAHKRPEFTALNPMGKLPTLKDDDVVVTESAAIGLYLADRYAYGTLAPTHDDPSRGAYLRWSLFAPSVIEPGSMAKMAGWSYKPGTAGWGDFDAMLEAIERALRPGPYLLGERFTMADVIFGGTLRSMLRFKMIDTRESFQRYADRLSQRAAAQRSDALNARVIAERGL